MSFLKKSPLAGVAIILLTLFLILSGINVHQRRVQPRYRLPGTVILAQSKPGDVVTQNNQQVPRIAPMYYVFSPNKKSHQVVITADVNAAKQAQKSVKKFNQQYQAIRSTGIKQMYEANHHNFSIIQENIDGNVKVTNKQVLVAGKNVKFKGAKITAKSYLSPSNQNTTLQVKQVMEK